MKHVIGIVMLLCFIGTAMAQSEAKKADQLYKQEKYNEALEVYQAMLKKDLGGVELYYNMANCYVKKGDLGYAVAYYEKALKLDPSDEDCKANLRFVNAKLTDKINEEEKGLGAWFKRLLFIMPADKWSWMGLGLWFFAFAGLLALRMKWIFKSAMVKAISFSAISLGVLFLVAGFLQHRHLVKQSHVVIVSPTVSIKASPSENAKELYTLHEGAKINRHDNNEEWVEVSVNNDNYGWVKKSDVLDI